MQGALWVAVGVLAALLVFAVIKKFVKMALVLLLLLFTTAFVWYAVREEAPADVRADMDEAAAKVGDAAEDAARTLGRKAGEVAGPAARQLGEKAKKIGEEAGKAALETARELGEAAVEEAVEATMEAVDGSKEPAQAPTKKSGTSKKAADGSKPSPSPAITPGG